MKFLNHKMGSQIYKYLIKVQIRQKKLLTEMYSNKLKLFDKLLISHVVQECGIKIVVFFLIQNVF